MKRSKLLACVALFAVLLIALPSLVGDEIIYEKDGGSIPDNNPSGFTSTITIPFTLNATIADVKITIHDLYHTRVGDLEITLEHEETVVKLADRPPRNVDLDATYIFADGHQTFWDAVMNNKSGMLPGGTYSPSGANNAPQSFASFAGRSTPGQWKLKITDHAGQNIGSYNFWTLQITTDTGQRLTFDNLRDVVDAYTDAEIIRRASIGSIPDNNDNGLYRSFTIDQDASIESMSVTFNGLTHSWAGDLIITLEDDSGRLVELTNRPGSLTGGYKGGPGADTDLNGDYTFSDSGGATFWQAASKNEGGLLDDSVPYRPSGDGDSLETFSTFDQAYGYWVLNISDNRQGDTGQADECELRIQTAPEYLFGFLQNSSDLICIENQWWDGDRYFTVDNDIASAVSEIRLSGVSRETLRRSKLEFSGYICFADNVPNNEYLELGHVRLDIIQLWNDAEAGRIAGAEFYFSGNPSIVPFVVQVPIPIIYDDLPSSQLDIPSDYLDGDDTADFFEVCFSVSLLPDELRGDANDDDVFNNGDIGAFVLGLTDRATYEATYPNVNPDVRLDLNGDGVFNNGDIGLFVELLVGG